jgi:predicted O-linked N-acetylglucosamine transferase (SPINDLY family)
MNPWLIQAMASHRNGHLAEAERLYALVLSREPHNFEARHRLGLIRSRQGRTDEALALIAGALAIEPHAPEALSNYANALRAAGRPGEALTNYDRALAIRPQFPEAWFNRGNLLRDMARPEEALASYQRALSLAPGLAPAWNNRGNALRELNRFAEALESYDRALALRPDRPETLNNRALALRDLGRLDEALASCDRALALRPDFADGRSTRGGILADLNRAAEALEDYEKAHAADPAHPDALNGLAQAALNLCDWTRTETLAAALKAHIEAGRPGIQPFLLLGYWDHADLQRQCAENHLRRLVPAPPPPLWKGAPYVHDKIRIAYLSADFRNSAAAYLTAALFEHHDRGRFEVSAISFGADDGSAMRARLMKAFDRFHDVRSYGDRQVAALLREMETDIAVDLMGYTLNARPAILAHRPCPVQVSWLGYPATMAAPFIDYAIADAVVLPPGREAGFAEKIVRLPHSYYPSDRANPISEHMPTRAEAGLPEDGFVFCSFNNPWKIRPAMFDVWMRLLAQTPRGVLWLLPSGPGTSENLRRQAALRGIDPGRLVFAGRMTPEHHLARHRLADLFLDTLPYNAHTTASDALWAGLPVITCKGESFSARVAASLLDAVGLPELVTDNLADYEALALTLANDPARLGAVRDKLARNRLTTPLFDSRAFRRGLEQTYVTMRDIARRGEAPRGFTVPADS